MVNLEQADPKYKHSSMNCRSCVQLLLDVYGIDAIIENQMLKDPNYILVQFEYLGYGRNPDINTLKKEKGGIFHNIASKTEKENSCVMSIK